ncbi:MAG: HD domain-containing protein [Janthinobacterium lividum]
MNVAQAEAYITEQLRQHLSPTLYYHGLHHTLDVVTQALDLAHAEGVQDAESLAMLRTAALFHDAGFLTAYAGHEAVGCELVRRVLPGFGYAPEQVDAICGCIMATKIPQTAHSHLAEILCDADLDYLGRADFYPISASLLAELQARDLITSPRAWDEVQVKFLSAHRYLTATGQQRRQAAKQARLAEIQAHLAQPNAPAPAAG